MPTKKPNNVSIAVSLMCLDYIIGSVSFSIDSSTKSWTEGVSVGLYEMGYAFSNIAKSIGFMIYPVIIYRIINGGKIARIVFVIFFVLAVPSLIFTPPSNKVDILETSCSVSYFVIQAVCLYLLFTKPGKDYFKGVPEVEV